MYFKVENRKIESHFGREKARIKRGMYHIFAGVDDFAIFASDEIIDMLSSQEAAVCRQVGHHDDRQRARRQQRMGQRPRMDLNFQKFNSLLSKSESTIIRNTCVTVTAGSNSIAGST